jgi:hypothetical protein
MRNNFISKILGALFVMAICSLTSNVKASSGTNTIADLTIEQGTQYARIALQGPAIGGRPGCHHAAYTVHYAFDISTAKGRALLATAQAALLSGKQVTATGAGVSCTAVNLVVAIETLALLTLWP